MNKMLIVKQISSVLHKIARKLISIKELWVQTLETKGLAPNGACYVWAVVRVF